MTEVVTQGDQSARPKVSVVVPVYNGRRFLASTVCSVLRQTYRKFEIIVVDDGSTDGSTEMLPSDEPCLRIIQQRNLGVSAARNRGLAHAEGEFVLFLDQDDELSPDCLEKLEAELEQDPDLGAASCDIAIFRDVDGRRVKVDEIDFSKHGKSGLEILKRSMMVSPGVAMFRKEAVSTVGGFDPCLANAGEDHDLFLKVALTHGWKVVPGALFWYRTHMEANSSNFMKMHDRLMSVPKKMYESYGPGRYTRADMSAAQRDSARFIARKMGRYLLHNVKRGNALKAAWTVFRFCVVRPKLLGVFLMEIADPANRRKRSLLID